MNRRCLFLLGLSFALPGFGLGPAYAHLSTTRSAAFVDAVDEAVGTVAEFGGVEGHTVSADSIDRVPVRTASTGRHFVNRVRIVKACAGSRRGATSCPRRQHKTARIRVRDVATTGAFRDRALPVAQIASGFRTGVLGALARVIGGDEGDTRLR